MPMKKLLSSLTSFFKKRRASAPLKLQTLQNLWYLLIFLVPLILNPWGNIPYEIPKIGFALIFIGAGIFIFSLKILLGEEIAHNKKILIFVSLWLLSLTLSTIFSLSPSESFWGLYQRMQGLLQWLFYLAHFLICLQIFQQKKLQKVFFDLTLFCGLLISVYAILQYFHLDPLKIGDISLFSGRSYATIGQPNMLGQWLIFPFFVSLFRAFESFKDKSSTAKKIFHAFSTTSISFALFTTLNRATFLGIGVAIAIFLYQSLKGKKAKILFATTIIATGIIVILSGSFRSFESRSILWKGALALIPKNPILGVGPEEYYQASQTVLTKNIYQTERLYDSPDRVHSEGLQTLLDQGLFGFSLYLIPIIFLSWCILKNKIKSVEAKIAMFALIATYVSLQFSFTFSAEMIYFLAFWAILLSEVTTFKATVLPQTSKTSPQSRHALKLILIPAFLIAFFAFNYSINIVKADQNLSEALKMFFVDQNASWSLMNKTISQNPHNAYYLNLSISLFGSPMFTKGNPELISILNQQDQTYANLTNQSFMYLDTSARFNLALGKTEIADAKFAEATKKAPVWTLAWQDWGEALTRQNRTNEAIEKLEYVLNLAPSYIWQKSDQTRIFNKTNVLFYGVVMNLKDAYTETNQPDKLENLKNLLKIKEETDPASPFNFAF